jgi:esterase
VEYNGGREDEWAHLTRLADLAAVPEGALVLAAEGYLPGDPVLHYLEWPMIFGSGRPLLFLHGGGLQAHSWDIVCVALRDDFRCVSLDLRGHGDSGWATGSDYGLEWLAADIGRTVTALGLEDVVLVGHSLGGLAALVYAATQPTGLGGLILVDAGPSLRQEGTRRIHNFITSGRDFASFDELVEHVLQFAPNRREELLRMSLRHNIRSTGSGRLAWKYDPAQFGASRANLDDGSLGRAAEVVTCPTLIVRGERSRVLLDEDARALSELMPDARTVTIAGAGHTVQAERPAQLAAEIRAFARSLAGSGRLAHG